MGRVKGTKEKIENFLKKEKKVVVVGKQTY
jgi:hypothetical protein